LFSLKRFFSKEKKTVVKSSGAKEKWIHEMLFTPREFKGPFSPN